MSKARISFAIIGLASAMAFAGPALAQDTGFYAGISFGQSSVDVECAGFTSCDEKDTAWKILGGYRFTRNLAVEVGYSDFGEQSASRPAGTVTFEATALEVVGVGSLPVADKFSVYGKIGMYRGDTDASDTAFGGGSASDSNTGLTFGFGAQYDFTKNLGIRAEWQTYADVGGDNVGESDVDVISVGVIWKF